MFVELGELGIVFVVRHDADTEAQRADGAPCHDDFELWEGKEVGIRPVGGDHGGRFRDVLAQILRFR